MNEEKKWHPVSSCKGVGPNTLIFSTKSFSWRFLRQFINFLSTHFWNKERQRKERGVPKHIKIKACRVYVVLYPSPLCSQSSHSFRDAVHPSCVSSRVARRRAIVSRGPRYRDHSEKLESMEVEPEILRDNDAKRKRERTAVQGKVTLRSLNHYNRISRDKESNLRFEVARHFYRRRKENCRRRNIGKNPL